MRSLVLAVTLFTLVGCSRGPEPITTAPAAMTPSPSTTQALVSTPSSFTLDKSQNAICLQQWTCDFSHWFSTQSACNTSAACAPGPCFRDFNCNGHCVCP
jgi:hypothetical protein